MRAAAVVVVSLVGLLPGHATSLEPERGEPQPGVSPATATHWASQTRRVVLESGLTVLLLQRGSLPIVSVEALYKVGSRNEAPGLTGAAHFIEHMAFRRTERINKTDLTNQMLRWGGRWGGYTSYDQTVYNAHAPSAFLDWLIFMERQRMAHVLFDPESVELERTSVISELRQYENSPAYTMAEHRLRRAALVAHPYGSPIMGWISDLEAVTAADLERFYREYYGANNLVLVIVGRFDEAEALALVRKHFADAPGGGRPTRLRTVEPAQTGERRVVHRGTGASSHLELLTHAPAAADPRYPALLVLDAVLAGGKAEGRAAARPGSRLHDALLITGLAQSVSTEVELSEYPGLHAISVSAAPDADLLKVEGALIAALDHIANGADDGEIAAAITQVLAAFELRDDSNRAIADRLARFEGIGSFTLLPRIVEAVAGVTAAQVRQLAAELLAGPRRNIGWFVPEEKPTTTRSGESPTPLAARPQDVPPAEIAQRHAGTVPPPATQLEIPVLPAVSLTTLPNGVVAGVAPLDGGLVHVRVRVTAGASHDPRGREGLAMVVARAVTPRAVQGIRISGSAASLDDPFSNRSFVEWSATGRRTDLRPLLAAMAGMLAPQPFPAEAVTRVRNTLTEEASALTDDSRWRADDAAWTALFGAGHPFGRPVQGDRASRLAVNAEEVTRFHRERYQPGHTIVAISGGVTNAEASAAIAATFGQIAGRRAASDNASTATEKDAASPALTDGGGSSIHVPMAHKEQASITVALPGEGVTSADYPALSLLNYLLGETGYGGRLGERLVDTGIAYSVQTALWPYLGAGPVLVTTDAVNAEEAIRRIRSTLAEFATRGLTPAQLDEAKGFVLGRLLFRFETPAAGSAAVANLATTGAGEGGLQAFAQRVNTVTLPELNTAAAKYYDPRRAVFVVAGR